MMITRRWGLAGALLGTLALGGCGTTNDMLGRNQQTWTLSSAGTETGAQGKLEIATGGQGNRNMKIEAKNLAPPAAAYPGTTTYVVWLRPEHGQPLNIGVLSPNKKEKAELKTMTPFTSFEIMVTAESTTQPTRPSDDQVLSGKIEVAT